MSCTHNECLKTPDRSESLTLETLFMQLKKCNNCVMRAGGFKDDAPEYQRKTRGKVGFLYAQKHFEQH